MAEGHGHLQMARMRWDEPLSGWTVDRANRDSALARLQTLAYGEAKEFRAEYPTLYDYVVFGRREEFPWARLDGELRRLADATRGIRPVYGWTFPEESPSTNPDDRRQEPLLSSLYGDARFLKDIFDWMESERIRRRRLAMLEQLRKSARSLHEHWRGALGRGELDPAWGDEAVLLLREFEEAVAAADYHAAGERVERLVALAGARLPARPNAAVLPEEEFHRRAVAAYWDDIDITRREDELEAAGVRVEDIERLAEERWAALPSRLQRRLLRTVPAGVETSDATNPALDPAESACVELLDRAAVAVSMLDRLWADDDTLDQVDMRETVEPLEEAVNEVRRRFGVPPLPPHPHFPPENPLHARDIPDRWNHLMLGDRAALLADAGYPWGAAEFHAYSNWVDLPDEVRSDVHAYFEELYLERAAAPANPLPKERIFEHILHEIHRAVRAREEGRAVDEDAFQARALALLNRSLPMHEQDEFIGDHPASYAYLVGPSTPATRRWAKEEFEPRLEAAGLIP